MRAAPATVLAAALLALAGCGTRGPAVLHFGMEDAPEGRRILYPPPPEVPRFLFAGQLVGESNFRAPGAAERGALERLWRAVAGLDAAGAQPTVLQRPVAVCTDAGGRIYVSDASRQAVFVFDEKAGELLVWDKAIGLTGFASPVGLAAAPEGGVFVADADLAIVAQLDRAGKPVREIGRGLLKRPSGLARDADQGLLYVADTYAHDVKVFDGEGRLVQMIGRRGEGNGEFNFPTHVAFARGELYVTDTMNSRVQVFSAAGEVLERKFGARGLYVGNLVRPKGVAVDGEGNVYVVESYYDHLLVFSRGGQFLLPIGGTGQETGRFFLPAGVWVDARNRVFVADMFNGRVTVFQFLGDG
ncbi:MAG: 6-bladed beta-propeller [Betaproteobacteria bacterium]|nr:6-bladed beta-propeller [Betaproteobacteria bacterium]MDH5219753.1 6-bladed beta-propeller [Betaproteobacteria bacterium]MDH5350500.1 6-bladed beta-propeller [Betaproteobacteria bacterium]